MTVHNPRSIAADHHRHDRLLVARHAATDLPPSQQHEAQDLIRWCTECAALAADINLISNAVGQLPAAARPRDFRLTAEQAANLRGSRLDRLLRTLTGSGWATVRPVAAVALSVGLVMSVVGVLPIVGAIAPATDMNLAAAPTGDGTRSDANGQPVQPSPPSAGAVGQDSPMEIQASAGGQLDNAYLQASPGVPPEPGKIGVRPEAEGASGLGLRDLLTYAGLGLTAAGLLVLVLLYGARRRFSDPLLR
jgi:hypothetical protein